MKIPLPALILVLLSITIRVSEALTTAQVTSIQKNIKSVVTGHNVSVMVRLAFHSCVGGCNGCIDTDNEDNAGLSPLVASLESVYSANNYSSLLSRADFWALGAIYAITQTVTLANADCSSSDCTVPSPGLVFQYGRTDCSTAPYGGTQSLPSANLDYTGVMDYFADEFGFNSTEVVALMGIHTIGQALTENSGFLGKWWLTNPNRFNNAYYQILTNSSMGWTQADETPGSSTAHYQWTGSTRPSAFMLNTDMALYKDVQLDSDGASSCSYSSCSLSSSASDVVTYANSLSTWVSDFGAVFQKMLAHGASNLQTPTSSSG